MKDFFIKLLVVFISIFLVIIFLEFSLAFIPEKGEKSIAESDPHIRSIYKKNFDGNVAGEVLGTEVRFKTNSHGFVGDEWGSEKPFLRIANFGDSFTAGSGVSYEKNYVSLLGSSLTNLLSKNVESLNFGVAGHSTADAYNTYIQYGRQSSSDVVILWFYLGNDFSDNLSLYESDLAIDKAVSSYEEKDIEKKTVKDIIKKSNLYNIISQAAIKSNFLRSVASSIPGLKTFFYSFSLHELPTQLAILFTEDSRNDSSLQITEEYIKKFHDQIVEDGKEFFVVLIPPHFQVDQKARDKLLEQYPKLDGLGFDPERPRQRIVQLLDQLEITHFGAFEELRTASKNGKMLYNCSFCHFSPEGHAIVANAVAQSLSEPLRELKYDL